MISPAVAAPAGTAFLGVETSLTGRRWVEAPGDERLARALAQRHDLPEVVARILAARGVGLDAAADHLQPTLRAAMPDPSSLKDMDRAADRLARAIAGGETIAVFGDYDVDGATSAALLLRYLRQVGAQPLLHIPDRQTEGYGPNAPALLGLHQAGATLVVTVDCGTLAFAPLEEAARARLDVIVLDHHTAEVRLPPAAAVVNPNRLDESGTLRQLAACGVVYLTLVAVNRALRRDGFFASRSEPDLLGLLDLVALGTICDVVPLTGLNRALVTQGLKIMTRRGNTGVAALCDTAKIAGTLDAYHAGYLLGPRINAGGRLGRSDLGARLLSTDDPAEAADLARILDGHNDERKAVEAEVQRQAVEQIEAAGTEPGRVLMAVGEGWHPGVVGIVAGRLKDRYNRPACVVALEDGVGRGSGRSVPGIDLGAAVIEAWQAGLLEAGGGHAMAAGFTVAAANLDPLRRFLDDHAVGQAASPPVPVLTLDGALAVGGATPALAGVLAQLGPFGSGNSEPLFALLDARPTAAKVVGSGHVSCVLTGAEGGRLRAIAFRAAGTALGRALLDPAGAPLRVAGVLRLDVWNGVERVQMHIQDAAPVWAG
ncbi:MAG: single-stranded-DNA-specific exonuclease RecJ [Inquilinaceae bacterium]